MTDLKLHEEILLLALDDEKGTAPFGSMYAYAMAGGMLTELVLDRRIGLSRAKKSLLVDVAQRKQTGDPLLDEALEMIAAAGRRATIATWVGRIARTKQLTERTAERLYERGMLRRQEDRVLVFFKRRTWPTNDPAPELELVQRIRTAIEGDGEVAGRTATIIALARSVDLLKPHIGKDVAAARKQRIEDIVTGNVVGDATREAIEAVTAAMVATTAAVTAATTVATMS